MITFTHSGNFDNIDKFLNKAKQIDTIYKRVFDKYGRIGVNVLSNATPKKSSETASMWTYEINVSGSPKSITWLNNHIVNGVNIAIILEFGHGTGTGGYVSGRHYINKAIQPLFDKMIDEIWEEVIRS